MITIAAYDLRVHVSANDPDKCEEALVFSDILIAGLTPNLVPSARSIQFLLVESNPADSYLIVEGLKRAGLTGGVRVIEDSQQALDYLRNDGQPDLILLDLNLAPLTGLELLAEIRSSPRLESIPVIVISGSENANDIRKVYQLKANCYINKPASLDQFLSFLKTCYDFWATVVTLPPRDSN